jgi:hypothetical protein
MMAVTGPALKPEFMGSLGDVLVLRAREGLFAVDFVLFGVVLAINGGRSLRFSIAVSWPTHKFRLQLIDAWKRN